MSASSHRALLAVLVALLSACAQPQSGQAGSSASAESDSARIRRLETEARALASSDGCTAGDQCRAAPLGERACGGPRDHVVYCARTTDSASLYRKLDELRQAEVDLNRKTNAVSTCEFRMPPELGVVGGSCKAR